MAMLMIDDGESQTRKGPDRSAGPAARAQSDILFDGYDCCDC